MKKINTDNKQAVLMVVEVGMGSVFNGVGTSQVKDLVI